MNVDRKFCKAYENPTNPNKYPVIILNKYVENKVQQLTLKMHFILKTFVHCESWQRLVYCTRKT